MKTPAYVQTLRPGLRRALFESCSAPNTLSTFDAARIARKYGLTLKDVAQDLAQANAYGARQISLTGNFCATSDAERETLDRDHGGRYQSARFLFDGYCYESARVSYCESAEARRNEDRAY